MFQRPHDASCAALASRRGGISRVPTTIEKVRNCLPEGLTTVRPDASFSDLGMDSLDYLEFLANIEQAFHISIPNARLKEFHTLADVGRFLENAAS